MSSPERLRRWRLVLGGEQADGTGQALEGRDERLDEVLGALYDADTDGGRPGTDQRGGLGGSAPSVSRWLGDIRTYFPAPVVRVMQRDAMDRLGLGQMLLEPEMLSQIEPDVHFVATLLSLSSVIPAQTRDTARQVVRRLVDDLMNRLSMPLRQAVYGSLNRALRTRRPRPGDINWRKTIEANLKHYQPDYQTVVPERLIGWGRRRHSLKDVVLALDQSGSMASSVVYAGVIGAVLASLPALSTRLVLFDTAVVDMTAQLSDPVDLLFGVRLGGGTDINRALTYCQGLVTRPRETVMVLISDLIEGGLRDKLLLRVKAIVASGVTLVALLALSDQGRPAYDHEIAAALAAMGVPAFACTPDLFPDLMGAALGGADLQQWAARQELV